MPTFSSKSSQLDDETALSHLALVLAVTILVLASWSTTTIALHLRRTVDAHWQRGLSYLRIGLNLMRQRLGRRIPLPTQLRLSPLPDPEPASASKRKAQLHRPEFRVTIYS